jgi:hypothetical protein
LHCFTVSMLIMQDTESSKDGKWTFTYAGVRWTWTFTLVDRRKISSEVSFDTRAACVEDALKHGYAGTSGAEGAAPR